MPHVRCRSHVTPEHTLGIAQFWGFASKERDYFLLLVDFERAGTKNLKNLILEKLKTLKGQSERMATRYEHSSIEGKWQPIFYSSWHYAAIHLILTIPRFQTVSAIASRLTLPPELVSQILMNLVEMALVEKVGERWKAIQLSIHIPNDSPLSLINHTQWRALAMQNCM